MNPKVVREIKRKDRRKRKNKGQKRRDRRAAEKAAARERTAGLLHVIVTQLEAAGISVDVQPSITTNSYYLTLDGGRLKKMRIGDHTGKGYRFTYEVGSHLETCEVPDSYKGFSFTRYLFNSRDVQELINLIIHRKEGRSK